MIGNIVNRSKKRQAIMWGVFALLPLLLACLFIYGFLITEDTRQEKSSVLYQGQRTTATITSREMSYREGVSLQIKYSFTLPSGQEQTGSYAYYAHLPRDYDVGDQLEIAYDPQTPTVNIPVTAEGNEEYVQGLLPFCITLFSLIACGMSLLFGWMAWKAWRLSKCRVS